MIKTKMYLVKNFPHLEEDDLDTIIEIATDDIKNYCNIDEIPLGLNNTLIEMCINRINTLNDSGISSVNGEFSMMLDFNYSDKVYKSLRRFRKLG